MKGFKPLNDRVLILPDPIDSKIGNILVEASEVRKKKRIGTIVSVGKKDAGEEFYVSEGDVVMYDLFGSNEIEIKGVTHVLMKESMLLGVIDR